MQRNSESDDIRTALAAASITWQGVSIDTRTIQPGNLFFALRGERFDGHDFLDRAFAAGAAACVISGDFQTDLAPVLRVPDTLRALQSLAGEVRHQADVKIASVIGSHGKTTTKDILAAILNTRFRIFHTDKNVNGLIGVPLTLLKWRPEHEIGVVEVGISKPGEMDILGKIAAPDIVIYTCVAPTHTEFLVNRERIDREKSKIFQYIRPGGLRILNADDPYVMRHFQPECTVTFGQNSADYIFRNLKANPDGAEFTLTGPGLPETVKYTLPFPGEHNIYNACGAIAAALRLGVPPENIQYGLNSITLSPHRSRIIRISGKILIDDTYNAAPASVEQSLIMLKRMGGGRSIAVLGDMLELGDTAVRAHEHLGDLCRSIGIDRLFGFGPLMQHACARAEMYGIPVVHVGNGKDLGPILLQELQDGDIVLIKASRGMRGEDIVRFLCESGEGVGEP